jgi:hypothetical protein
MWGAHNELQQSTRLSSSSWFDARPEEDYGILHDEAYSRIQQPSSTWGYSPEWDRQLHVRELGYRLPLHDVSAACMSVLLFAMEPSNEEEEGEGEEEEGDEHWQGRMDLGVDGCSEEHSRQFQHAEYRHAGGSKYWYNDVAGDYGAQGTGGLGPQRELYGYEGAYQHGNLAGQHEGENEDERAREYDGVCEYKELREHEGTDEDASRAGQCADEDEDEAGPARRRRRKARKPRHPYTVTCALRKTNFFESSMEWEDEHFRSMYW